MSMVNYIVDGELYHHGIKGQRWGDRNYQYEDGSLTPEGRRRYYGSAGLNRFRFGDAKSKPKTKEEKEMAKANSAYRVERHKAKMERKTQEALNKERIKKEQSNAKRNAEIAKIKGNKPIAKINKKDGISEDKTEDTRNNKKFDKHVKELLNNKKIKDYSKYTDEELEAAAKRKETQNSLEAQKRAGTKIGRLEGYLKSPEGSKLLATTASSAIEGLSKIAADSARAAIATYLKENSKEMFERSVDMAGWERKRAAEISKAESEAAKARNESSSEAGRSAQEWHKAKGVEEENTRKQMEFDEQKSSREARNKAEISKAKSEAEKARNESLIKAGKAKSIEEENTRKQMEFDEQKSSREARNKAEISKAESEAEKAKNESLSEAGRSAQEWRKAKGIEEENTRKQMVFDEQKSSREARNKAEIAKAKAEISKSQLEKIKNKNAADLEKLVGVNMKSGWRPDDIARARINVDIQKYSTIENSEAISQAKAFDRFMNSLSKEELRELFASINANKK